MLSVSVLAHLSTKCSGWAIVTSLLKPHWILTKLNRNGLWVVPYQNCSNGSDWSQGQKIGFQNAFFKKFLVWNYKAQSFHIWYITSCRGPLPKLYILCPWGQNWPRPGGHNYTLNYIRNFKGLLLSFMYHHLVVLYHNSLKNCIPCRTRCMPTKRKIF